MQVTYTYIIFKSNMYFKNIWKKGSVYVNGCLRHFHAA